MLGPLLNGRSGIRKDRRPSNRSPFLSTEHIPTANCNRSLFFMNAFKALSECGKFLNEGKTSITVIRSRVAAGQGKRTKTLREALISAIRFCLAGVFILCSTVTIQKRILFLLIKKSPPPHFYRTWRFITLFIRARNNLRPESTEFSPRASIVFL